MSGIMSMEEELIEQINSYGYHKINDMTDDDADAERSDILAKHVESGSHKSSETQAQVEETKQMTRRKTSRHSKLSGFTYDETDTNKKKLREKKPKTVVIQEDMLEAYVNDSTSRRKKKQHRNRTTAKVNPKVEDPVIVHHRQDSIDTPTFELLKDSSSYDHDRSVFSNEYNPERRTPVKINKKLVIPTLPSSESENSGNEKQRSSGSQSYSSGCQQDHYESSYSSQYTGSGFRGCSRMYADDRSDRRDSDNNPFLKSSIFDSIGSSSDGSRGYSVSDQIMEYDDINRSSVFSVHNRSSSRIQDSFSQDINRSSDTEGDVNWGDIMEREDRYASSSSSSNRYDENFKIVMNSDYEDTETKCLVKMMRRMRI